MRVEFYGLKFDLPEDWTDVTDDLPEGSPPTMARSSGVGALQFSIARYRGGEEPQVEIDDLRRFLEEFCHRNGISGDDIVDCSKELMSVKINSCLDDELIIARYFSDGRDVLLATYVCQNIEHPEMNQDLKDIEIVLNSIELH